MRPHVQPIVRALVPALLLAALVGCSDEIEQSTRPDNVIGSYVAVTYQGRALPARVAGDSASADSLLASTLTLTADHRYSGTTTARSVRAGRASTRVVEESGSWALDPARALISFYDRVNGYQYGGIAAGGTLTVYFTNDARIVYRRQ